MTDAVPEVVGFRYAGVRCGIKQAGLDLALIASDRPAAAAGVFTRSTVPGAPVVVSRKHLRSGRVQAIVANSGCSNVAMGAAGVRNAEEICALAARGLGIEAKRVAVASTGVIGVALPMQKLRAGIPAAIAALAPGGIAAAAQAIMTTDTFPKLAGREFEIGGKRVAVAGICKGSGMIEPDMATMLAYLTTDAAVEARFLRVLWREVADASFNRVTVDGESSTSDTALVLANGASGAPLVASAKSRGARALESALHAVATELARALARDGEGATKLVTVEVTGARNAAEAERAARRIANSMLVKTALFGNDPNWGRILQTVGAARVRLCLPKVSVKLCGVCVFAKGASTGPAARAAAGERMKAPEIAIELHLAAGKGRARLWTCDLSYDYVRINAEYTT